MVERQINDWQTVVLLCCNWLSDQLCGIALGSQVAVDRRCQMTPTLPLVDDVVSYRSCAT